MNAIKDMYEVCDGCEDLRKSGSVEDLQEAVGCKVCKGKGIVRKPSSYICNACGGSMITFSEIEGCRLEPYGLVETTVSGGYFSNHLHDCTNYTFSICEKCLRSMFDKFVVPPVISGYMGNDMDSYEEDSFYYKEMLWRKTGGQLEKLKQGLCNNKSACPNKAVYRVLCSGYLGKEATCEEHKKFHASNHEFIPFDLTDGIIEFDDATDIQKEKIVNAYFMQNSKPGFATHYDYVPDVYKRISDIEIGDKHACLWIRNDVDNKRFFDADEVCRLDDGIVVVFERAKALGKDIPKIGYLDYYCKVFEE